MLTSPAWAANMPPVVYPFIGLKVIVIGAAYDALTSNQSHGTLIYD